MARKKAVNKVDQQSEKDFAIIVNNINQNMKRYDKDIRLRMAISDQLELERLAIRPEVIPTIKIIQETPDIEPNYSQEETLKEPIKTKNDNYFFLSSSISSNLAFFCFL